MGRCPVYLLYCHIQHGGKEECNADDGVHEEKGFVDPGNAEITHELVFPDEKSGNHGEPGPIAESHAREKSCHKPAENACGVEQARKFQCGGNTETRGK